MANNLKSITNAAKRAAVKNSKKTCTPFQNAGFIFDKASSFCARFGYKKTETREHSHLSDVNYYLDCNNSPAFETNGRTVKFATTHIKKQWDNFVFPKNGKGWKLV